MARPLQGIWESYEAEVVPADASPVQRQEMQRAFYAGARIVLIGVETLSRREIDKKAGARMLGDMNRECEEFAARIGADF